MSHPPRSIHVMAAVITDARGRVLLARRGGGRDLAGLWEFPGGKREPGETSEAALVRELQEELGITVKVGAPLMQVPQVYPDKRLRLDVRRVTAWQGIPHGKEGQALAWVAPEKLVRYAMPPADRPVVAALLQPGLYLVTPPPQGDGRRWLAQLGRALKSGITRVQLRAPGADPGTWRDLATEAVALCRRARAQVLVNGDATLAAELGTGLHLRAAQLHGAGKPYGRWGSSAVSPHPQGRLPLLSASCHDAADLAAAQALGCDFAVLGPVQPTATHPGAEPLGWEGFERLRDHASLPIYAIGGLQPDHLSKARSHGAQGIAAITSLWG